MKITCRGLFAALFAAPLAPIAAKYAPKPKVGTFFNPIADIATQWKIGEIIHIKKPLRFHAFNGEPFVFNPNAFVLSWPELGRDDTSPTKA